MASDSFPYQINAFLDQEPNQGEGIYGGEQGWFPHINLKRKFCLEEVTEARLIEDLHTYASTTDAFDIELTGIREPTETPLPIRSIEVVRGPELMAFHLGMLNVLRAYTKSKFPEREGPSWFPHITLEDFDRAQVVNPGNFVGTTQRIGHFWLVRDPVDGLNAQALARYELKS